MLRGIVVDSEVEQVKFSTDKGSREGGGEEATEL